MLVEHAVRVKGTCITGLRVDILSAGVSTCSVFRGPCRLDAS